MISAKYVYIIVGKFEKYDVDQGFLNYIEKFWGREILMSNIYIYHFITSLEWAYKKYTFLYCHLINKSSKKGIRINTGVKLVPKELTEFALIYDT